MAELLIIDDILAPMDRLKIQYEGKNPFLAVTMTPGLIKDVMKIPGKDLLETDVRWDILHDQRTFYGKWMGRRAEDRWTTTKIRIVIQGDQHAKEKTGSVTMWISGWIETKYEFSNFIQRAFWWAFNYAFYYRQRRAYLEFAKDNMHLMKEKLQNALGILQE